ncbi:MAG: biotin transporter BioY [Phycisphaerae bacterium]|jgi:biotin transport system substrate-specific component
MNMRQEREIGNGESLAAPIESVASNDARSLKLGLGVAGCVVLTALASQIRVPIPGTEVPMTLQLVAVLLTGFLLPPVHAVAAMMLYLGLGAAGAPVFAPGSAGLAGSTGGYLVGFAVSAWLVSVLKGPTDSGLRRMFAAGAVGTAALFVCGIAWRIQLALSAGLLGGDVWLVVVTGFLPFAPKALIELSFAVMLARRLRGWGQTRR